MKISLKSVAKFFLFLFVIWGFNRVFSSLSASPLYWSENGISLSPEILRILSGVWDFMSSYFAVFIGIYMAFIAFVILMEGQNPDKTLLWLILIIVLPVVGFVAYMLLGPDLKNRTRRKELKKRRKEREKVFINNLDCKMCDTRLGTLILSDTGSEVTTRNRVKMLIDGEETFAAIKLRLSEAKKYINMEYFSIADDVIGNEIADILISRAKSGVKVRVLYDDVGSWSLTRKYINRLRASGIEVHAFMPVVFAMMRRGLNFRNHRKIIVIDGEFGFLGGLNIGDMYLGKNPKLGKWRDTHMMIEGGAIYELNKIFVDDWNLCTNENLDTENFEYADIEGIPPTDIQIAPSGPDKGYRSIERGFFHMITNAQKRIWITTPYLVPGEAISYALAVAAKSGVDVRIIYPEKADHILVHWASIFVANQMLRAGVKIYSYYDGFIHAKTMLSDDNIVSVGTTNLDTRSLEINYEAQAFIYSKELNGAFAEQFLRDLEGCREQTIDTMNCRKFTDKIKEAIGRLWSSLL